jgi:DHA2 family multidrug resistance protein
VISQFRSSSPILNFAVFKHPQFVIAAILGFVFGAGNFGSTYIIPVFVQTVQDFTPTAAGMVTVPAGFVVMCLYPIMGRLVDTFPIRYLAMTGLALFAFGMMLFWTTDVNSTFWTLAVFAIIGRLGFSIMIPAINVSALSALPPDQLDQGAGTINFVRLMGGAFGVNTLVVFMEQRTEFHSIALTATQTSQNSSSRELLDQVGSLLEQGGVAEALLQPGALHFLGQVIEAQANTLGFKDGFLILSVIFILALVPAWRMGKPDKR